MVLVAKLRIFRSVQVGLDFYLQAMSQLHKTNHF